MPSCEENATAIGLAAVAAVLSKYMTIWKQPRSQGQCTNIVLETYTYDQWRNDFRMARASFDSLCNKLLQTAASECVRL